LKPDRQRGQALTELVLLLPLFSALLLSFLFLAKIFLAQLALIQLTRDFALLVARNGPTMADPLIQQEQLLKALAKKSGTLDPAALSFSLEPEGFSGGGGLETVGKIPPLKFMADTLWPRHLQVHYHLQFGGMAGWVLPQGLLLEEEVRFLADPWKHLYQRVFQYFYEKVPHAS
jgi:hypothetical protein